LDSLIIFSLGVFGQRAGLGPGTAAMLRHPC
jgi:hypothetical protein